MKLYYENSLRHAANKKYIAKTPLGNGKYRYFYTKEEYDAFMGIRDKISRTGDRPNTKYFDKKIDNETDRVVYVEKKGGLEQMNRDAEASLRLADKQKYGTNARIDRTGRNESARSGSKQTVPEKNRRTITRTQEEVNKIPEKNRRTITRTQEEAKKAANTVPAANRRTSTRTQEENTKTKTINTVVPEKNRRKTTDTKSDLARKYADAYNNEMEARNNYDKAFYQPRSTDFESEMKYLKNLKKAKQELNIAELDKRIADNKMTRYAQRVDYNNSMAGKINRAKKVVKGKAKQTKRRLKYSTKKGAEKIDQILKKLKK